MKRFPSVAIVLIFLSCNTTKKAILPNEEINILSKKYVQMALYIGQYDTDFVDAYYGPDSLQPKNKKNIFPKDSLVLAVQDLSITASALKLKTHDALQQQRLNWLLQQLRAFDERIHIYVGLTRSFDEEANNLFGVQPPHYPDQHYKELIKELDATLPGNGTIEERLAALNKRFIIPKNKIDTVFKTAIAEARRRTKKYYRLPATENFELEYVTNKPWSGYNWYKGNYKSLIQINTESPIMIERAIDLACHEGYPGHHVYNMLLEQNLYNKKGWQEISLYPLFSPQSLIAEGSANYGIELAFPGKEKNIFIKNVLLPLAGLDTTYADVYLETLSYFKKLNFLRNEVAAGLFDGSLNEDAAKEKLMTLGLMGKTGAEQSLSFIKKYRSYVLNYNFGLQLIREYIEKKSASDKDRWQKFYYLLSNPVTTADLLQL